MLVENARRAIPSRCTMTKENRNFGMEERDSAKLYLLMGQKKERTRRFGVCLLLLLLLLARPSGIQERLRGNKSMSSEGGSTRSEY